MAVEVVESCMVKPGEATPKHRLWLSNLDHLVPRSHMTMVFFYRSSPGPASSSPHVLKAALSKALVPFYPLAGRLAADGAGRPEISCTGDGARFVIARSDARLDDMGDLAPSDELRRALVPPAEGGGGDHASVVLAMFQVTFFNCGAVCLGTAIYRAAADGRAFGNFLRAWAAMARGVAEAEAAVPRPWLDRTLLRARSPPSVRFDHAVAVTSRSRRDGAGRSNPKVLPLDTAILPVSRDQVDALKASAGTTAAGKKVSTFNAVVAHVWVCACKSSSGGAAAGTEDDTRVYMTADARSRVRPPLPDGYVGNAVVRALAVAKMGDIVSGSLAAAVARVSDATFRLSDEFVRSLVDYLEQATSGKAAAEWPVIPETDLGIVSWLGLTFSELDFGWGRPAFVGPATIRLGGRVYLVPSPDDGGGVDVVVAMEPVRLARFKVLFYEGLKRCSLIQDPDRRVAKPSKL
jgi:shikimate O-hydroxycinnamoyltransferase